MSLATNSSPAESLQTKSTNTGLFAWPVLTVLLVTAIYLPTLNTRFDFIDDGNLVYPAPLMSLPERLQLVWDKIEANYRHLGPFRPVLWVHWEIQAEWFHGNEFYWRCSRLVWTCWATAMMLWLLQLLGVRPLAAAITTALAMWNPWRGEVWTSLTLAEGVAMPYAILALICAIKAARSPRPWLWDIVGILCMLAALGCKNTFAAIIPVQVLFRMAPDGTNLKEAWRHHGPRACLLAVTLIFPIAHFIVFKLNRREGNYDPGLFSWEQLGLMLGGLKGALSLDYLGVGFVLAIVAVGVSGNLKAVWQSYRAACLGGLLLLVLGVAIYLPMQGVSGRYTMPAAWGADLLIAALLSTLTTLPASTWKRLAYGGLVIGMAALAVVNVARQDKFAARAAMLWETLEYVERQAPSDAGIAWMSGTNLNIEEGIHFQWHLAARGRNDVRIVLLDEAGKLQQRQELLESAPAHALSWQIRGSPDQVPNNLLIREFGQSYHWGRGRFVCYLAGSPDW